jgi:hypothetical protein
MIEAKLNLYQRINKVMLKVVGVKKGVTISMGGERSYTAVSHDDVTYLLHVPCAEAGIVIAPSVIEHSMNYEMKVDKYGKPKGEYQASVIVELTVINMDNPEERLSIKMPSVAFDSSDKAYGKAISMATKYALLKLFMLDSYDQEEEREGADYIEGFDAPKSMASEPKKEEKKPQGKTVTLPTKTATSLGDYSNKVATKFKGAPLRTIPKGELISYCQFMSKDGKVLDGEMKEFIDTARKYLTGASA